LWPSQNVLNTSGGGSVDPEATSSAITVEFRGIPTRGLSELIIVRELVTPVLLVSNTGVTP